MNLALPLRPRGLALPEDLRGLTLHALWTQAIVQLGKDTENRRWRHLPRAHVGQLVALHAGALDSARECSGGVAEMEADGCTDAEIAAYRYGLGAGR
jgi:hypothetical protein